MEGLREVEAALRLFNEGCSQKVGWPQFTDHRGRVCRVVPFGPGGMMGFIEESFDDLWRRPVRAAAEPAFFLGLWREWCFKCLMERCVSFSFGRVEGAGYGGEMVYRDADGVAQTRAISGGVDWDGFLRLCIDGIFEGAELVDAVV